MKPATGSIVALILAVIAVFHTYWAFGGTFAVRSTIPQLATSSNPDGAPNGEARPLFTPGRWGTLAVAALLLICAMVVATAAGLVGPPEWARLARWPTGFASLVFFVRAVGDFRYVGFFKHVTGTPFARLDTLMYSPLCLALAIGCAYIVFG